MAPLLPGQVDRSWLARGLKFLGGLAIGLISVMPYLLLFSLFIALLLIPVLRRLRSELNQTINITPTPLTDITPWHQKLIKKINGWR
jgi:hypothetical protein